MLVLIGLASSCHISRGAAVDRSAKHLDLSEYNRLANLKRAAQYPWNDGGRCAVRESSGKWAVLVETCYEALDLSRIRFEDKAAVCPLAQAGVITADQAMRVVGICLLVQPQLVVGAVIVIGVVVVAAAIAAEIEAAERSRKAGCRCSCLKKGEGPYTDFGRVESPAVCAQLCRDLDRGFTGSVCK